LVDQRRRGGTPEAQAVIDRRHRRIREIESRIRIYEDLITKTVVRHEIAHQVLFNYGLQPRGASNPRWLREGLAMQFEAPAGVNRHRMEDFLALDRAGLRLNLRDLIADPEYLGPGAADLPGRYAAAWALVHRLVHERPRALAAYLEISSRPAATGEPVVPEAAKFQATFGKLDTAFERKLVTYVEALSRQPTSTASTPAGER
ncbi:MAG: DUF1570 domain-containing protein, partial [Paracoccaceae bacterium]